MKSVDRVRSFIFARPSSCKNKKSSRKRSAHKRHTAIAIVVALISILLTGIQSAWAGEATVEPAAIGYVDQEHPSSVLDNRILSSAAEPGRKRQAFFMAEVRAIPMQATSVRATLKVYSDAPVRSVSHVHWTNNTLSADPGGIWSPSNLTWNNKPNPRTSSRTLIGSHEPTDEPGWIEIDVTPLVNRNGTFSMALQTEGGGVHDFFGADHINAPEIDLSWRSGNATPLARGATKPVTSSSTASNAPTTPTAAPRMTSTTILSTAPTQTKPANTPRPTGVAGDWTLKFNDDFNGNSLDLDKWSNCWFSPGCGTMNQVATSPDNVAVANGNLVLTLSSGNTGALVSSNPRGGAEVGYEFKDGVIEARIHFPGTGNDCYNWPAWWTDGQSWPQNGEHDVAEVLDGNMTVNYHSSSGAHNQGAVPGNWCGEYHIFTLHRKDGRADVYYDGELVKSYTTDDGDSPHYMILNMGAGNHSAYGTASQMKVDYVRAWQ